MTLATVSVVVSKELSTSHDCCPNQHGYIRSSQTSLGRASIHTHTQSAVGGVRWAWRPSHPQSAVSTQIRSHWATCSQVESSPHLHPISHSFLGTLGIREGVAENLVLQVLSKNGFATGTTPVRSVSTKSCFHHRLALRLHQHQ